MAYQIDFEGDHLTLDLDEIDVAEARTIKNHTGLTLYKFQQELWDVDPDCVVVAYWLAMKQSGKPAVDIGRTNFKLVKFSNALQDAVVREAKRVKELEEANPTEEQPVTEPEPTS